MTYTQPRDANPWTTDLVEALKQLWTEGLSCAQIARAIGYGFTRNAVVGKATRLNLQGRAPSRAAPQKQTAKTPKPVVIQIPLPLPAPVVVVSKRVPLEYLGSKQCRWQLWPDAGTGGPDFISCGNDCYDGAPYCEGHLRQAYQSASAMRARNKQAAKEAQKAVAA